MIEYDYSLKGEDWCKGCVFEFRFETCDHDVEDCKKVMRKLNEAKFRKRGFQK